jgi:Cof subfamily protein (haloacid dehalogenase superfamily)
MVKPAYRLLVCDLDGTILQHNGHVSARVKRAITLAMGRGVWVTLATGRSFQSALPYASAMNIHLPLICYQGGLIQHANSGETLYRVSLSAKQVQEAVDLSRTHGWQLILYSDHEVQLTEYRYPTDVYRQLLGPTIKKVTQWEAAVNGGPIKLTFMAEIAAIPTIEAEMKRRFDGQMVVFRSHPMFVEGIPPGVSKGAALAWLAEHLEIAKDEVMAIGDQDNDASMVAWAGMGVAMGNGSERCKRAADWIAPTISEDGAATVIEQFLL